MNIHAVIGANYGDEGKGLCTELLCRDNPFPVVILSNGGCQRGHTVHNRELSCRHVFHNFGSGTLLGIPTVYSNTFLLNPISFVEEYHTLPVKPVVFRTPGCLIQFPGDMFTNQTLEKNRGDAKHGSCGWGIWETFVRNKDFKKITFEEFAQQDHSLKIKTLGRCLMWQFMNRIRECNIDETVFQYLLNDSFVNHFINDTMFMYQNTILLESDNLMEIDWSKYGLKVETYIVENGQGLALDEDYAPKDKSDSTTIYTTPTSCGLNGVIKAIGSQDQLKINAYYVSRTYFTRHGEGPFPEESNNIKYEDYTNVYNQYQGYLRFGEMNKNTFRNMQTRIDKDILSYKPNNYRLILTHCHHGNQNQLVHINPYPTWYLFKDDSK